MNKPPFEFCKYPDEVCDNQCSDCKGHQMWGERNLTIENFENEKN